MIDPAPYDYDTETFDKEAALRHVLSYPAFENALSNHKEQLHEYLSLSGIITDGMEQSYKARKSYKAEKMSMTTVIKTRIVSQWTVMF